MFNLFHNGQQITGNEASAIAKQACAERGIDPYEMFALMHRLVHEEDARDQFFDMTDIEVIDM